MRLASLLLERLDVSSERLELVVGDYFYGELGPK